MRIKAKRLIARIGAALRSNRGKDVLLYLLFVAVAFVFWVFLALDTERQRDFDVPFELTDVPDSVTLISPPADQLFVSVKGKDSQLLRFMLGNPAPVKFKWDEYSADNLTLVTHNRLDTRLRDYFGPNLQIVSFRPDSISTAYTTQPGVRVKLNVQADIRPNIQYILSGAVRADVDSVTLYSDRDIPHSLRAVSTEPLVKSGLKDSMRYEVKVKPIAGIRIIPDRVVVTVPIEPLIARKRVIRIEAVNLPEGVSMVTFPSEVEVSYLVPMSSYNSDFPLKAYVDYKDTFLPGSKVPVSLSVIPSVYHNVSQSVNTVDYILENP